jgi:hypothetical protein
MLALRHPGSNLTAYRLHVLNPDVTACSRWTISDPPLKIVREVGRTPFGAFEDLRCECGFLPGRRKKPAG